MVLYILLSVYLGKAAEVISDFVPISYVEPKSVVQKVRNPNCTKSCELLTPFFDETTGICTRARGIFCPPDVEAWADYDELEYTALLDYYNTQALDLSEADVFVSLDARRTIALETGTMIPSMEGGRRLHGFDECRGGSGGGATYCNGCTDSDLPTRIELRSGSLIDRIEVSYPGGKQVQGGGNGGGYSVFNNIACIKIVNIKSGSLVDNIQFIYRHTDGTLRSRYPYGGHGGSWVSLRKHNHCVGQIALRAGRVIDQFCFNWVYAPQFY